jgi:hypothetical protein
MNTAGWFPTIHGRCLIEGGDWTLFSPSVSPTCTTAGARVRDAYVRYEGRLRAAN